MNFEKLVDLIKSYEVNLYDEVKKTTNKKIYFKLMFDNLGTMNETNGFNSICIYGHDYELIEKSRFDNYETLFVSGVCNTKEHSMIGYIEKETNSVKRFKSRFESDGVYCKLMYILKVINIKYKDKYDSDKIVDLII